MLKKVLIYPFLVLIKIYQYVISPLLPGSCRYTPTCSEYSKEAFIKYGFLKGLYLSLKRILSCHPWGAHGQDPLK